MLIDVRAKVYLTEQDLQDIYQINDRLQRTLRSEGLPSSKIGNNHLYKVDDLFSFFEQKKIEQFDLSAQNNLEYKTN